MDDFLGNLASKSLGLAPILQPRPMSRFEPWPTNGVLETAHRSLDAPLETERVIDRVETGWSTLRRENAAPVQARPDPLHYEPRHHDDEAPPRAPTLQPFPPSEPKPAVTQQAALMPASILSQPNPRTRAVSDETAASAGVDKSSAIRDGSVAIEPHALPLAQPFVERTERVIVEREPTAREHGAAPVALKPTVSSVPPRSAPLPLMPAPVIEAQPIAGQAPAQRAVVERERADRGHADQPSLARSPAAALPAPIAADARSVAHPIVTPIIERMERTGEKPDGGEDARSGLRRASQQLVEAPRPASEPPLLAPPTIHVTIGRIEVRAAPPPAPVKRPAPAASTMSLEEYLRSHAGNRR